MLNAIANNPCLKLHHQILGLPSVATQQGICLKVPKGNSILKSLFESLGGCVECENEEMMKVLMAPTGKKLNRNL